MIRTVLVSVLVMLPGTAGASEHVQVTSPRGVLAAEYRDAGAGAPGVLLLPMCRADAGDGWAPVADRLLAARVSSLSVVSRGGDNATVEDAEASFAYLRSRVGATARVGVAGSSCGVSLALETALRHPGGIRAIVAFTGPHSESQLELVRRTPALAVLSGASAGDTPAPDWARELKDASAHPASRLLIADGREHGTDAFRASPALPATVADWFVSELRGGEAAR